MFFLLLYILLLWYLGCFGFYYSCFGIWMNWATSTPQGGKYLILGAWQNFGFESSWYYERGVRFHVWQFLFWAMVVWYFVCFAFQCVGLVEILARDAEDCIVSSWLSVLGAFGNLCWLSKLYPSWFLHFWEYLFWSMVARYWMLRVIVFWNLDGWSQTSTPQGG